MLRRSILTIPALLPTLAVAQGAEPGTAARPVRVGVTNGVHAQVFEKVSEVLARDGFITRAVEFGEALFRLRPSR